MVDDKNGGGAAPDKKDGTNTSDVTDTIKTDTGAGDAGAVDTSKFTDADWAKIYSDPKLYNHPRFKGLNDEAKRAKVLDEQISKEKEAKLVEEKKFQELAALKEKEANEWKGKASDAHINNAIALEANKLGVIDIEAVTKLIERGTIKLGEDGIVTGAAEAVKALITAKPYLVGKGSKDTVLGGGSNPSGNDTQTPSFNLSQLQDPVFWRKHEKEIAAAFAKGLVKNDMAKSI